MPRRQYGGEGREGALETILGCGDQWHMEASGEWLQPVSTVSRGELTGSEPGRAGSHPCSPAALPSALRSFLHSAHPFPSQNLREPHHLRWRGQGAAHEGVDEMVTVTMMTLTLMKFLPPGEMDSLWLAYLQAYWLCLNSAENTLLCSLASPTEPPPHPQHTHTLTSSNPI